ncbi:MAG: energy transducer TonB [Prevotella sp.]|nr:energy transducer TonB [Prevotella sp.]
MTLGKHICKTLKEIRLQVAKANDIHYAPTECRHKGDCSGTCPKCEQELRYIEEQLDLRRAMGKAVSLVGISVGLTALTSCNIIPIFRPTAGEVMRDPHEQLDGILDPNGIDSTSVDSTQKNAAVDGKSKAKSLVVKEDTTKAELIFGEIVEQQAAFPGGEKALLKFIDDNMQYTKEMEEICVTGRVVVSFTIERDGSITDAKVVKSLHPLFDKEALRIVGLMPKWSPAMENGEIKKVTYNLPIPFKLK